MAGPEVKRLVYFWCVGNAMRSQMAEGFLRHYAGDRFEVASAGTHPFGDVIPEVVVVMKERGIDISRHTSDGIDADLVTRCYRVIDLGGRGRDRVPGAFASRYEAWQVADPYGTGMEALRGIRDQIEERVKAFIARHGGPSDEV